MSTKKKKEKGNKKAAGPLNIHWLLARYPKRTEQDLRRRLQEGNRTPADAVA
jgi:hypothetical protein